MEDREIIKKAAGVLRRGGVIVYPTDTIYGLGADPANPAAVEKLFRIKKRPASKPAPLLVSDLAAAKNLAFINSRQEKFLRVLWYNEFEPVTVVLEKRAVVSSRISGGTSKVGLRRPDNDFCLRLLEYFGGPITATSANISGEEPASTPREILAQFKAYNTPRPDLVIDGGILSAPASTVLDLTSLNPKIIRVGPTRPKELLSLLGAD